MADARFHGTNDGDRPIGDVHGNEIATSKLTVGIGLSRYVL
jgi:hypothetical protein